MTFQPVVDQDELRYQACASFLTLVGVRRKNELEPTFGVSSPDKRSFCRVLAHPHRGSRLVLNEMAVL